MTTTTTTETTHKQTVYIIKDHKGTLHMRQHAPTMSYAGRKDSDQYALMLGVFIDNPSHDLWIGKVQCHTNISISGGISTIKNQQFTIVAKMSFNWDMSKPIGERQTDTKKSLNFDKYKSILQEQNKK